MMSKLFSLLALLAIAGCATPAQPVSFDGTAMVYSYRHGQIASIHYFRSVDSVVRVEDGNLTINSSDGSLSFEKGTYDLVFTR